MYVKLSRYKFYGRCVCVRCPRDRLYVSEHSYASSKSYRVLLVFEVVIVNFQQVDIRVQDGVQVSDYDLQIENTI